jgi:hypothetical protein
MERTTLYLDAALKRRLKAEAKARRTTEAKIVREALHTYLGRGKGGKPRVRPVGTSHDGGVAHRLDDALDALGFGKE